MTIEKPNRVSKAGTADYEVQREAICHRENK